MKQRTLSLLMAALLLCQTGLHAGGCTGSANCTACSNCSQCKHCSRNGGSCGVCEGQNNRPYVASRGNSSAWRPGWLWIAGGIAILYICVNSNEKRK